MILGLSYFAFRYYHIGRVYDRIRGATHFVFQSYHIVRVYHEMEALCYIGVRLCDESIQKINEDTNLLNVEKF